MKKILVSLSLILLTLLSKTAHCQHVTDTSNAIGVASHSIYVIVPIRGRVIGLNLQILQGVTITDKRTGDKTNSDSNGIYQLNVAKGDTLTFELAPRSQEIRVIKRTQDPLNVILKKRTADQLP